MTDDLFTCEVCGDLANEISRETGDLQIVKEAMEEADNGDCEPDYIDHIKNIAAVCGDVTRCVRCSRIRCPSCEDWCCDG